MELFKRICQTTAVLFKQAWLFPHSLALARRQKQRQVALDALETERLDRIRHPSKYLCR
jgi:hypothetical protein